MMAVTHAVIAATGVSFALGDTSLPLLGMAVFGSQLPDVDSSESYLGQILFPLARWIEERYPHRTVTHSFLATAGIALATFPLVPYLGLGLKLWIALWLGHLIACFSDTFTKQGVQLFWPQPVWCVCGSNPHKRLTTGGTGEYWVLAIASALLILNFYFTNSGGLVTQTSLRLGLKEGAFRVYNNNGATHHVYLNVEGVKASDRTNADGSYFIVGSSGSNFVVTDGDKLYETGRELVTTKYSATVGAIASTTVRLISFADEDAVPKLQQLIAAYPGSAIYLSGQITVDFPEEIQLFVQPDQFESLKLLGGLLQLKFHPIEQTLLVLKEQFVTGNLEAKIITPKPTQTPFSSGRRAGDEGVVREPNP